MKDCAPYRSSRSRGRSPTGHVTMPFDLKRRLRRRILPLRWRRILASCNHDKSLPAGTARGYGTSPLRGMKALLLAKAKCRAGSPDRLGRRGFYGLRKGNEWHSRFQRLLGGVSDHASVDR
jgi:hypothetical protein